MKSIKYFSAQEPAADGAGAEAAAALQVPHLLRGDRLPAGGLHPKRRLRQPGQHPQHPRDPRGPRHHLLLHHVQLRHEQGHGRQLQEVHWCHPSSGIYPL